MVEQLVIGQIVKAHGLKGEVKLRSFSDNPERFQQLRECALENAEGKIIAELKIKQVRIAGPDVFLSFIGYPDRSAVEALLKLYLSVPRSKGQSLGPDSWYVCDLIGLEVFNGPESLGRIKEIQSTGHQDLLRVTKAGQKDLYIPLLKQWLEAVDLAEARISLKLPEGLIEVFR
ncbi:MAG: ribosome maturation factor RimM [Eubacteriales bacterium]|nr:ribosome maturation factor RimM [Eubacteriales bacterium]